ncbi:MAG: glutamate synthase large subunit [Rhodospirillaceae bacterium]|nr:glutamate synthase large subunit [Rhodospirillaceae bacterium]
MTMPNSQGLYDPRNEHDACGVGFVAHSKGAKSHDIIRQGLQILENLEHRGAVGADPLQGDGAGIIIQTPDAFLRAEFGSLGVTLPPAGDYGIGMIFLPKDKAAAKECADLLETITIEEGQTVLGWRDVPVDPSCLGESTKACEPWIRQVVIGRGANTAAGDAFERKLYIIRKLTANSARAHKISGLKDFYIPSFSSRTLVYKGMFLAPQLAKYYRDLHDARMVSALALVHQRFSTNTFPSWRLAHPYRMVCHNGEINTLRGNLNWMAARRHSMKSSLLGDDLKKLWPLIAEGQSDTASFDNALELLVQGGYSLAHAVMMMIPEAWAGNPLMDDSRKAFYEYHAGLMEPWDGPAAIAFTDGRQIGATLDRNGLRPARYLVTDDGLVVMASEAGVLDIPEHKIVKKWRLQPGKMFLIDFEQGRIIDDAELKTSLAAAKPYKALLAKSQFVLEELPGDLPAEEHPATETLLDRQQAFGYTQEDLNIILDPIARNGEEATGSMGTDSALSVLSARAKLLYSYFKQNFAQVTNPPIDPIREELVMSLVSLLGPKPNLLGLDEADNHLRLEVRQPILTDADLSKIRRINELVGDAFKTQTLDITYPVAQGADGMSAALKHLCAAAHEAVEKGFNILILSDRNVSRERIAIPALLATAAVHHHLIRMGLRTETGLVVETGEAREVHHFCTLAGYGAEAINPYLAFETMKAMRGAQLPADMPDEKLQKHFIKAIGKGMLKVMSKMGISTFQSYCGAQIFDAVGLSRPFIEKYFTGTASAVDGVGLKEIAEETAQRHRLAFGNLQYLQNALDPGGEYAYRIRGEDHMWTPDTVAKLQHAARAKSYATYEEFSKLMNDQSERLMTLRGLFELKKAANPVPLDEVEPAAAIVKRFASGAMSYGSISREAHSTLAIAMNRIGAKSNTGEGGEEADRFKPLPNGDSMRSAIKQVASGRFGVTTEYLVNADDIQIKMAQGAKPGEGGQLPGDKVNGPIAKVRHSTPGVGLISPPPHHDIYSIEDLAQLIHDLKNVNPKARISVKLVSEIGVGTVAAGVAKARADHVTISGYEGGTGASPLTSLTHAGSPWEIGIAETHQTLVLNNLRGRIAVQVDGGFRTGRDVVIGALLGADEFGFATAPLIALGCIMMRKCHLNTCPVGVATQNPELRKRFTGQPEHVINYLFFIAEEARQLMASMGFRKFSDMIGRSDMIDVRRATDHYKAKGLDFTRLLHKPVVGAGVHTSQKETQDHGLDKALDHSLIAKAKPALDKGTPVAFESPIRNINRTAGAMLSGEVARKYGHAGLKEDTISVKFKGIAGQSFGAFLARGVSFELVGAANDYTGKGLSGGRIAVYPPADCKADPAHNIIVGNTTLYGAIEGECYFSGVAGERFAVRNSGAIAVVEGVGDHGCEYMTGGAVVVLGATGRNFAAGMSGGIAYVLDEDGTFEQRCNTAMIELERIKPAPAPKGENGGLASLMADPLNNDVKRLYRLIERHSHYTNSARAKHILENWDKYLPKFVKIVPVDYRRALTNLAAAGVASDAARKKGETAHG